MVDSVLFWMGRAIGEFLGALALIIVIVALYGFFLWIVARRK